MGQQVVLIICLTSLILVAANPINSTIRIQETCISNPHSVGENASSILHFFNGCYRDSTDAKVFFNAASTIMDFFDTRFLLQLLFMFLFSLPYLMDAFSKQATAELISRLAYYILQVTSLMFRFGLGMSMSAWMYCVFRQTSPCLCQRDDDPIWRQIGTPWGMPSGEILVGTLAACHILERWNILAGILLLPILPAASVVTGYSSVGQVCTAFAIGFILHIYLSRTPPFMRIVDFVINLIAGLLTIFLVKHFYKDTDFTFATRFFEGILWMLFSGVPLITMFSMSFFKIFIRKTPYSIHPMDIQYLNLSLVPDAETVPSETDKLSKDNYDGGGIADEYVFTRFYSYKFVWLMMAILFIVGLIAVQITSRFMNEILGFSS